MGKTYVKNGTPAGNENLCRNCSNAQITTGYRDSDMLVICTNVYPSIAVPFVVYRCTDFQDKFKPDWEQMEKLAIEVQPVRISKKTRGFGVLSPEPERPEYEPAAPGSAADDEDDQEFQDVDAVALST